MTKVEGCTDNLPCSICADGNGPMKYGSEGLLNHLFHFHKIVPQILHQFYQLSQDIAEERRANE